MSAVISCSYQMYFACVPSGCRLLPAKGIHSGRLGRPGHRHSAPEAPAAFLNVVRVRATEIRSREWLRGGPLCPWHIPVDLISPWGCVVTSAGPGEHTGGGRLRWGQGRPPVPLYDVA